MKIKITPNKLDGVVCAIQSKSYLQRALICSSLCKTPTQMRIDNFSNDVKVTLNALKSIGANVEIKENVVKINGAETEKANSPVIDCGENGTALRLLLPLCCVLKNSATFLGEGNLPNRPIKELLQSLKGVKSSNVKLPLTVSGRLTAGEYNVKGDVSSQFISGLLIALPLLNGDSKIIIQGERVSKPYIDLTLELLNAFSVKAEETEYGYFIKGNQSYVSPENIEIEGDYTSSAFYLGANAFGNRVRVIGLNPQSKQGDKRITELLLSFNAKGTVLDLKDNPDLFPILSVCSCFAYSDTLIKNVERLKYKECDRLSAMIENINKAGGKAYLTEEGLKIEGRAGLKGGATLNGYNDHRIIMALAFMGTETQDPIIIENAEGVEKSYPKFFEDFIKLGGKAETV